MPLGSDGAVKMPLLGLGTATSDVSKTYWLSNISLFCELYREVKTSDNTGSMLMPWQGGIAQNLEAALRLGYRHIDTAQLYQNHTDIGKVLARTFAGGDIKRKEVHVTSKVCVQTCCQMYLSDAPRLDNDGNLWCSLTTVIMSRSE